MESTWGVIVTALFICAPGCTQRVVITPPEGESLFRDEFEIPLEGGWMIDAEANVDVDLASRAGFARLVTPELSDPSEQTPMTLLVREAGGDFVLVTRVEFQTITDLQLAGLVIQGDDGRTVVLGIFSATSSRGSLRGLILRADRGMDILPGRAIAPSDIENAYLRLERSGNKYTGSYGADGQSFTVVGSLTDDLSDHVRIGIGTAADARCTQNCDQRIPADFDFFEVLSPGVSSN